MPTLNWIGKNAVVKHHKEVPFRLLEPVPELSCGAADSGNLIVQGDNLHALKALLPRYAGQVKCIYIDPPYNTGNEGWAYNDNVNSPEIRKWLGEVVGKEGETLDRHDRWLCMMYPRLLLLKQFLHEDGVIFVSIDDDEVHHLRALMDEVFGYKKRLATFVWRTDGNFDNQAKIKNCHEYVLAYAISPEKFAHPNVVDPSVGVEGAFGSCLHRDVAAINKMHFCTQQTGAADHAAKGEGATASSAPFCCPSTKAMEFDFDLCGGIYPKGARHNGLLCEPDGRAVSCPARALCIRRRYVGCRHTQQPAQPTTPCQNAAETERAHLATELKQRAVSPPSALCPLPLR